MRRANHVTQCYNTKHTIIQQPQRNKPFSPQQDTNPRHQSSTKPCHNAKLRNTKWNQPRSLSNLKLKNLHHPSTPTHQLVRRAKKSSLHNKVIKALCVQIIVHKFSMRSNNFTMITTFNSLPTSKNDKVVQTCQTFRRSRHILINNTTHHRVKRWLVTFDNLVNVKQISRCRIR